MHNSIHNYLFLNRKSGSIFREIWKHFPRYWPFVRGIHRSPVNSSHKDQWRGALMFSLICVCIDGWVNNREAGDLRRYRTHYDVIVMDPWNVVHQNGCHPQPSWKESNYSYFLPLPYRKLAWWYIWWVWPFINTMIWDAVYFVLKIDTDVFTSITYNEMNSWTIMLFPQALF